MQPSMEIPQLSKTTFNNQLQQSTYLCDARSMSKFGRSTHFARAKVEGHTKYQLPTPNSFRDIAQIIF